MPKSFKFSFALCIAATFFPTISQAAVFDYSAGTEFDGIRTSSDGFTWSIGYFSREPIRRRGSITEGLDNNYDHINYELLEGFSRQDGQTFSVTSVKIDARDFMKRFLDAEALAATSDINFRFSYIDDWEHSYSDVYVDLFGAQLETEGFDPENDTNTAEWRARVDELRKPIDAKYEAYLEAEENAPLADENRLFVSGFLDGVEVAKINFGSTGGLIDILLDDFTEIDTLVFGSDDPVGPNRYMWNHYAHDYHYIERLNVGDNFCQNSCLEMTLHAFEYELSGAAPVAPIPLPATLPLLFGGFAFLGGLSARRSK